MNSIFSTFIATLKSKVTAIVTKLKLWTSGVFWRTQVISKLREFFSSLFNIKPKDKDDYYTLFGWMISKKLAFSIIIGIAILSTIYILTVKPVFASADNDSIPTYKYNALALKFKSGDVKILDSEGTVAYIGNVDKNTVTGKGTLYDEKGNRLYTGDFDNNMFNGEGSLFYPDGTMKYNGGFVDNLFSGAGKYYQENGIMRYSGDFLKGHKEGKGTLFNSSGEQIYVGTFRTDRIVPEEMIGLTNADAAKIYTGSWTIYQYGEDVCKQMTEIEALAYSKGGNSLDDELKVDQLIKYGDMFVQGLGDIVCEADAVNAFGAAVYSGYTSPNFPETVALKLLADKGITEFQRPNVNEAQIFERVHTIASFYSEQSFYMYTYSKDGILYDFYCESPARNFFMYSMRKGPTPSGDSED